MPRSWRLDWDWNSRYPYAQRRIEQAAERGLKEAADKAVSEADVPVRSGALKRSGRADVAFPVAVVSFGATGHSERGRDTRHYAIPNHESFRYKHPRGGTPKFLTRQLHPGTELLETIARHIRRVVDRG
ncbi:hypothetical protein [Saccharopolyspora mangrovi]|uniref:HK97 gp10 family phage protein n=1 Tax=Saccharopolyspora mangrovi TaxID=3082379 RepID=A0ABU6A776_9PSEU|nr:hypothetical protein [Saccharopolyspora sp. S2-29]MEB3367419.1 hypothetical protein [Saccharopolyspora sp. S2-29]